MILKHFNSRNIEAFQIVSKKWQVQSNPLNPWQRSPCMSAYHALPINETPCFISKVVWWIFNLTIIVHFDGMYLFFISAWNMKFPELWNEYLCSCCGVWNFFPQLSQVWFRMSMCEKRSCRNLWPVLLNCFPHKEHMCFPLFSSLFRWFLQCLLRSSLRMKLLPHSSHVYGLWFKCRYLSWTSNAVELEKT